MEDKQNFNIGDLVELKVYFRKPRLKGIILKNLGYNKKVNDFIYEVYSLTRHGTLGMVKWTARTLKLLSPAS
jgi:hypothetical protein